MKKEHVKSIVLTLLVITNVFLVSRIWFNKKLWPDGYNFFANTEKSFMLRAFSNFFNQYNNPSVSKTHISTPEKIIINTGYQTTRFSLNSSHEKFKDINDMILPFLSAALSSQSKAVLPIPRDEWYSVLTGKSIYLSYNTEFDTKLLGQFLGAGETDISSVISNISDIAVAADSTSSVTIYIQDRKSGIYYKILLSNTTNKLEETIDYFQQKFDDTDANSSIIINYSFDLLFDKAFGSQKTILQPLIPIYSNPQSYNVINAQNPICKADGTFNQYGVDKILKLFEINPNTVRRYTESNGTLVYVENNCTLKISTSGVLEYVVKDANKGLRLTNNTASSYDMICSVADLMDDINNDVGSNKKLTVSSSLSGDNLKSSELALDFDYVVNGIPVQMTLDQNPHAVTARVENGYLKKYVQVLRTYDVTSTAEQTPLYIEALDTAIAQYSQSMEQIVIDKMFISYFDDGSSNNKKASWNVVVKQ